MQKLILFDIDETLIKKSISGSTLSSERMFNDVFHLETDENVIDNTGLTEAKIIRDVVKHHKGNELTLETIPTEAYSSWAAHAQHLLKQDPAQVLPGVHSLLEKLSTNKGYILGLLTGNSMRRSKAKLESAILDHFFTSVGDPEELTGVFGDVAIERDELIDIACTKYQISQNNTVIVDDSLVGAIMASKRRIKSILVATGKYSISDLGKYSSFVLPDLSGINQEKFIHYVES